jgi:hypothetical protein
MVKIHAHPAADPAAGWILNLAAGILLEHLPVRGVDRAPPAGESVVGVDHGMGLAWFHVEPSVM